MHITPRLHGLLSLTVLLVMVNIVYLSLHVPAKTQLAHLEERLDSMKFQLSRYHQIVNSREQIKRELDELKASTDQLEKFISAPSSTLAVADLQNRLKSLVEQHNGRIISLHPQPVQSGQNFEKLTIRLQFASDIKSLQQILHSLATHKPVFFIDEVVIQSRVSRGNPEDSLDTRIVISAYSTGTIES